MLSYQFLPVRTNVLFIFFSTSASFAWSQWFVQQLLKESTAGLFLSCRYQSVVVAITSTILRWRLKENDKTLLLIFVRIWTFMVKRCSYRKLVSSLSSFSSAVSLCTSLDLQQRLEVQSWRWLATHCTRFICSFRGAAVPTEPPTEKAGRIRGSSRGGVFHFKMAAPLPKACYFVGTTYLCWEFSPLFCLPVIHLRGTLAQRKTH